MNIIYNIAAKGNKFKIYTNDLKQEIQPTFEKIKIKRKEEIKFFTIILKSFIFPSRCTK
jgi:hypothetical protein